MKIRSQRGTHKNSRGQIMMMFALFMSLFLFALYSAVVNLTDMYIAAERLQADAETAAENGAQQLDFSQIYASPPGPFQLDASQSVIECEKAGDAAAGIPYPSSDPNNMTVCTDVTATSIHAQIRKRVSLPSMWVSPTVIIQQSFDAQVVGGCKLPTLVGQGCQSYS